MILLETVGHLLWFIFRKILMLGCYLLKIIISIFDVWQGGVLLALNALSWLIRVLVSLYVFLWICGQFNDVPVAETIISCFVCGGCSVFCKWLSGALIGIVDGSLDLLDRAIVMDAIQ